MNENQRDQLIRETLDQCLSGIDTMPSARPVIAKKLEGNPKVKRHIPYRRLAVPAMALTLCVCLIVTGIHFDLIRWPDKIRAPENRVTSTPVALAQPECEGNEGGEGDKTAHTPMPTVLPAASSPAEDGSEWTDWGTTPMPTIPADVTPMPVEDGSGWTDWGTTPMPTIPPDVIPEPEYDERLYAVLSPLEDFVRAWENKDVGKMTALCGCEWTASEREPGRAFETVWYLASAISPSSRLIENAGELDIPDGSSPVTASLVVTDISRQARYRFQVRMLPQADGSWQIDPASFENYEQLEYTGKNVVSVGAFRDLLVRTLYPDIAYELRPVNLSCESSGIRLEIVSAAVNEQGACVLFSLEDTKGRLNGDINISPNLGLLTNTGRDNETITYTACLDYDETTHKYWYVQKRESSQPNLTPDDEFSLLLTSVGRIRESSIDLMSLLTEYGARASLVDLPQVDVSYLNDNTISGDFPREGHKVLDYTRPLDIAVAPYTRLTGIGLMEDGLLHVQIHELDNEISLGADSYSTLDTQLWICKNGEWSNGYNYNGFFWSLDEDVRYNRWADWQIPCTAEDLDNMTLELAIDELWEVINGQWIINFRAADVWAGESAEPTASPMPEALPTPTPMPAAKPAEEPAAEETSASAGTVSPSPADMFSRILAEMTPVNAVCEKAGVRFEVHAAEAYEDSTRVLCSLQDMGNGSINVRTAEQSLSFGQDISHLSFTVYERQGYIEEEQRAWFLVNFIYDGVDNLSDRAVTVSVRHLPMVSETGEVTAWLEATWSVQVPLMSVWKETEALPEKYSEEFFARRLKYTVNDDGTAVIEWQGDTMNYLWSQVVIPAELDGHPVTAIADGAFKDYTFLESVVLPDSIISIGAKAFSDCYRLNSINLPENLQSIGDRAFFSANLQDIVLPASLVSIGGGAFEFNHSLNCIVAEGSYAQQYCEENDRPYTLEAAKPAATPMPAAEPVAELAGSALELKPNESPEELSDYRYHLSEIYSLCPDLEGEFFPVNLYWTDGTVRLDILSAAVGETESWVVYALRNARVKDSHLDGLDNSPLSEPEKTDYYELGIVQLKNITYYAARIRYSQPDPERKTAVLSIPDVQVTEHRSIQNMKSEFLIYECLSGGLIDLPSSVDSSAAIMDNGKDITPEEFRNSGSKILDYTHPSGRHLSNGLELSGIGLDDDGMLHIQFHCTVPVPSEDPNIIQPGISSWYIDFDHALDDHPVYNLIWSDPAEAAENLYAEYILPWAMEDFDKYSLSIELFEILNNLPDPLTVEITRPE